MSTCASSRVPSWRPDETAADLFGRLSRSPLRLPCLPAGLHAGEALELFGEPGTGKTALLMACALQCIIPARFDGVAFGGHGEDAVLLDTDGGFDPLWLGAALQARFYSAVTGSQIPAPTPAAEGMEDKARRMEDKARRFCNECMGRLHVLQCCDRHQLLCSLYALPRLVGTAAAAATPHAAPQHAARKVRLLLVDSPSAFQWVERAATRHQQRCAPPLTAASPATLRCTPQPHGLVASLPAAETLDEQLRVLLRRLLVEGQMCAVWSRCPATSHGAGRQFPMQSGAPPGWAGLATHRLDLKRAEGASGASGRVEAGARLAARLVACGGGPPRLEAEQKMPDRFEVTIRGGDAVRVDVARAC